MEKEEKFIRWFSELSNKDVPIAGGKGASLAEMYNAKIPVPPGFVITAQAYAYFIHHTGIGAKIKSVLTNLDIQNTEKLNQSSREIRAIIEHAQLPKEMQEEIIEAYNILCSSAAAGELEVIETSMFPFVAVRSSATTEDLADASFAGQQESFLNVRGNQELLEKVKKCMSSLFTARAIYYRQKKGFDHDKSLLSVVVQKMVDSEKSGVMFSRNPTRNDKSIVIEAVWGLGEGIVSGAIKPDHYAVDGDLDNFKIKEINISKKKVAFIRTLEGENKTIKLNEEMQEKRVLDNYEIKRLAQYARQLEEHYKKPQDIEFAIDKVGIFIVQSRPITTTFKESEAELHGTILLSGLGASPGIASGPVKVVHHLSELEKVKQGDVLVTEMTNPDMVVSMQKAAAIITDEGGITSHAAIVSREMGIPAVVGTGEATKKLKDGEIVTVDGSSGKVVEGKGETRLVEIKPVVPTRTKIKVIVDIPEGAERAARSKARGVGLLRLEGIIAASGIHPLHFVNENKISDYTKIIATGIKKIASYFDEVWVRTSDIRTDEFVNLKGAPKHVEGNPMLGDHGVRFSLKHPEIMKAELEAIKRVAHDFPDKKLGVMIPQVISVSEVHETKKLAHAAGIPNNVKIGIMVETPAAVQIIEEICKEGISFVSFGTNDLTQYTLAIDRNNEEVQDLYTEMHPAVLKSIQKVIRVCKQHKVETSICGQAASREDMASFLIGEGIDSLSVNADAAQQISMLVAQLEEKERKPKPREFIMGDCGGGSGMPLPEKPTRITENKTALLNSNSINEDIEAVILKELDNGNGEYAPSIPQAGKENIPALNDSIPIESEFLENQNEKEVEAQIEKELSNELKEWRGEKKS